MRILVVEDQSQIAGFIKSGLEENGFAVEVCRTGEDGFQLATTESFDAMVLDIMLPGRDGLSVLRGLRERNFTLPIILLTARNELNERIEGLNLGADDYLTKPFFVEELSARLQALMRRSTGTALNILKVGDLSLDLINRKTKRGGAGDRTESAGVRFAGVYDAFTRARIFPFTDLRARLEYLFRHRDQHGRCCGGAAAEKNRGPGRIEADRSGSRGGVSNQGGPMRKRSFRFRLALISMGLSGLVLLVFGAGAWWALSRSQLRSLDADLKVFEDVTLEFFE